MHGAVPQLSSAAASAAVDHDGEPFSLSIGSRRMMIQNYCKQHGITLIREFAADKPPAVLLYKKDVCTLEKPRKSGINFTAYLFAGGSN